MSKENNKNNQSKPQPVIKINLPGEEATKSSGQMPTSKNPPRPTKK